MDDDVMDLTPRPAPTLQGTLEMLATDEVFVDYICRVVCRAIDRGITSNSGLRGVMAEAIRNAPLTPVAAAFERTRGDQDG